MIKKMLKTFLLRVFDPQRICGWGVYWNGFREWGRSVERKVVCFFCITMTLLVLPWMVQLFWRIAALWR